ncbi:MAG: hypothetical protein KAW09_08280 [Thermoplasmata archaeon]|nr:hypothetical protein [Thermoplasmata archaeon]
MNRLLLCVSFFCFSSAVLASVVMFDASLQDTETSDWTIETVEAFGNTGFVQVDLAMDERNAPYLTYYTSQGPGIPNVRYAVKLDDIWHPEGITETVWGGGKSCIVVESSDDVHVFYDDAGLYHASQSGSGWLLEEVDKNATRTTWVDCDATMDSKGNPHVAYVTDPIGGIQGEVKYAFLDGMSWALEKIDDGGVVSLWASIDIDSQDRPHILYYGDVYGEVRYAVKRGDI